MAAAEAEAGGLEAEAARVADDERPLARSHVEAGAPRRGEARIDLGAEGAGEPDEVPLGDGEAAAHAGGSIAAGRPTCEARGATDQASRLGLVTSSDPDGKDRGSTQESPP